MPCSGYGDKNPTVQLEADDYMFYVDYSRFNQNFEIQISGMLSYNKFIAQMTGHRTSQ